MRISRVYTEQNLSTGTAVQLSGQTAHYLSNVLRLETGARVILFNGDGQEYQGQITLLKKGRLELEIQGSQAALPESHLRTLLGLGISRGDRMDYAIQKSTELGVSEIFPLFTEFGEVKLKAERLDKRLAHWQKVAISASEQCGRNRVPKIHPATDLSQWLTSLDCEHKFIFDQSLNKALDQNSKLDELALLIGPEGGFSNSEIGKAESSGFKGIQLGPRVLRTETAPVAALAVLQYLWGDFHV